MIRAPRGLESGYAGDLVAFRAAAISSTPEQGAGSSSTPEQGAEGVPSLHELCSRVVTDCYLSPKTVCEVMEFAKAYNVPMLQRRVELFVCHAWAGVRAVHDLETLQQGDVPHAATTPEASASVVSLQNCMGTLVEDAGLTTEQWPQRWADCASTTAHRWRHGRAHAHSALC